jgi:hypothetical protein
MAPRLGGLRVSVLTKPEGAAILATNRFSLTAYARRFNRPQADARMVG